MNINGYSGEGYFIRDVNGEKQKFSGPITTKEENAQTIEEAAAIEEEDVDQAIAEMDFPAILDQEAKTRLRSTLTKFAHLFRGVGLVKDEEFEIKLIPGVDPLTFSQKIRRKSPREEAAEADAINKHLENKIVDPSDSPLGVNNVFVRKKTRNEKGEIEMRMATDFRGVNAGTVKDAYPLEDMGKILEWLSHRRIFSTMDLRDGYWGIKLKKEHRYLTAIKTSVGLVQYTRMAMGLKNAGPFYQRMVDRTLKKLLWITTVVYQDDISCATETEEEKKSTSQRSQNSSRS